MCAKCSNNERVRLCQVTNAMYLADTFSTVLDNALYFNAKHKLLNLYTIWNSYIVTNFDIECAVHSSKAEQHVQKAKTNGLILFWSLFAKTKLNSFQGRFCAFYHLLQYLKKH